MKIYLAGPMRGIPEFNFPAFKAAAEMLRAQGHFVFNPAEKDEELFGKGISKLAPTGDEKDVEHLGLTIRVALGHDLAWICKEGEAVAVLPGWEKSKGACAEKATGDALGIVILHLVLDVDGRYRIAA